MTTLQEKILEALRNSSESDKLAMWNDYANAQLSDDYIYSVNGFDFDDVFSSANAAVNAVIHGKFSPLDTYVTFDGYGNLRSFNDLEGVYSPYDVDVLADYLAKTGEYVYYLDIDDEEEDAEEGE